MNLQTRIILALLLLAAIALGTGSVLLLGYVLAGASLAVMLGVFGRRLVKRLLDARLGKPGLLSRPRTARRESSRQDERRAA